MWFFFLQYVIMLLLKCQIEKARKPPSKRKRCLLQGNQVRVIIRYLRYNNSQRLDSWASFLRHGQRHEARPQAACHTEAAPLTPLHRSEVSPQASKMRFRVAAKRTPPSASLCSTIGSRDRKYSSIHVTIKKKQCWFTLLGNR